ncbi:ATP-dependent RecD-like DNA helicase [Pseudonocardia sp. NPDC049635]|uniref:ATP-dependent DNA helicase n=1 Tax=Pseudonocardia sp. NPDC049635 TaxID=3155506 RepID=UPI0033C8BE64
MFRLSGPAGSGKTTIIRTIVEQHEDLKVAVTSLAGKASDVLRSKGLPQAVNLHQLWYLPLPHLIEERNSLEFELKYGDLDPAAADWTIRRIDELERTMFIPAEDTEHDLIIVDEASMVDAKVTQDLLQFGRPILAVGDANQLPPVGKTPPGLVPLFADQDPDHRLTRNHRSTEAPLITAAAEAAISGLPLPAEIVVSPDDVRPEEYDVVIVSQNKSRWHYVKRVREARGLPTRLPVAGDEIMIFRNDRERRLFNGMIVRVDQLRVADAVPDMATVVLDDGTMFPLDLRGFVNQKSLDEALKQSPFVVASWSEAMTCHKAQGSEWPKVLVADQQGEWTGTSHRWLYTAVTRARSEVAVVA